MISLETKRPRLPWPSERAIGEERRSNAAEQMVEANGVELCTERFGDVADPPILLIMGNGA